MNKENIIDLSKLPAVEGKNIVNIIALNGAGEIIKADSDYITTESLAATIEPFVTDEELNDRLTDYYLDGEVDELLSDKQDILVSGTNIKTINGESVLGSGNIELQTEITVDSALSTSSTNPVQNKVIAAKVNEISNSLPKSGNGTTVENGVVNISTVAVCVPFGEENAYTLRSTHPEYGIGGTLYKLSGDNTIAFSAQGSNGQWGEFAQISVNTDVVALKTDIPSEWTGTQSEYDALGSYDSNTTYYIIEEEEGM